MISHDLRPYKRRTALSQSTNFTMANEDSMIDWSDDDEWCHEVDLDPVVQVGGGEQALFHFNLQPAQQPRRWRNIVQRSRFNANLQQLRAPIEGDDLGGELADAIHRALRHTLSDQSLNPQDRIHFTLQSNAFSASNNHCHQSVHFFAQEVEDNTPRFGTYLQQLAKQLNSNQSFDPDGNFSMDVTTIRMPPAGSGKTKYGPVKAAVRGITKRSRISINNKDTLCCARAIVTMKAWADEQNGETPVTSYQSLRRGHSIQALKARELHTLAGVTEGACNLEDIAKFQTVLTGYQIKVLKMGRPHMIVYAGPVDSTKLILLIQDGEHFDGCTSFGGFLNKSYFCHNCNRGYNSEDIQHHSCNKDQCQSCFNRNCTDFSDAVNGTTGVRSKPLVECQICCRKFYGLQCLANHSIKGTINTKSVCDYSRYCPACCKNYRIKYKRDGKPKGPRHKCGWTKCKNCEKHVEISKHLCFIQQVDEDDDLPKTKKVYPADVAGRVVVEQTDEYVVVEREPPLLVYADYEAITNVGGVQSPILICYETDESDDCQVIYGENCTDSFMESLEDLAVDVDGDDRNVIVFFHNLKGYDGMFLLQHCYENHREVTGMVSIGAKVLSFRSDRITFKDSLCFLPFPLSSFPATFGLTELCKGYFPHLFNTDENQTYSGAMPDVRYYDPDGMSSKKKEDFLRWHASKVACNYEFTLVNEMKSYCESDVKLLKAGCRSFIEQFRQEADFNPLEKCITIASACHRYWRKKRLEPRTIAVEPPQRWQGAQSNQSFQARQWLTWKNKQLSQPGEATADRIRHAFNGGEVRVAGYLVDGFDSSTNTVYEYNGCFFHGCPRCYPDKRFLCTNKRPELSLQDSYSATLLKADKIRAAGFHLVTAWECDWKRECKNNETLKTFLASQHFVSPLRPRDAFFGGRTNAVQLHHHVDDQEKIHYQDVTSLYPWVNKYKTYPVKHPDIITTGLENVNINQFFGLAKVTILPPRWLFHPVLPLRHGGKLTFPLCRTCVETEMEKPMQERTFICKHSVEERQLVGTWCTPELQEAVTQGYVILTIHEVWNFPPSKQKEGLFKQYVNTWLKIKTEASGYPGWVDTPAKKEEYVANYSQKEGINLDPACIAKKPRKKSHRQAYAQLLLG